MKTGRILNILLAVFLAVWLGSSLLLHSNKISGAASEAVSSLFEKVIGTNAETGHVTLLRPSGLSIEDLLICDTQGDTLFFAGKLAVRFKPLKLLSHKFDFSSVSIFSPDIRLRTDSASGIPNWQFLADKFSGGDGGFPNLRLNSVIIRNGRLRYDIDSIPVSAGQFNTSHINLSGLTANISVKELSKDSVNVNLRRLSLKEHSGFVLKELSGKLAANESAASVQNMIISLSNGDFTIESADVEGIGMAGKCVDDPKLALSAFSNCFQPSDLSQFIPVLKGFSDKITTRIDVSGSLSDLSIGNFRLTSAGQELDITANGCVSGLQEPSRADIKRLNIGIQFGNEPATWLNSQLAAGGITIPSQADALGESLLNLDANGKLNDNLKADAVFNGTAGHFNISLTEIGNRQKAVLTADGLNLGQILDNSQLGTVNAIVDADGTLASDGKFTGNANADVTRLDFRGHSYSGIGLESQFTQDFISVLANVDDSCADLRLSGAYDRNSSEPSLRAELKAGYIDLSTLGLTGNDSVGSIKAEINANLQGSSIDNLCGEVEAYGIEYVNSEGLSKINSLNLIIRDLPRLGLTYTLNSDILTASVSGHFKPSTLAASVAQSIKEPLPTIYALISDFGKTDWDVYHPDNKMAAYVRLYSNDIIGKLLHKKLIFNGDTKLEMAIDDKAGELGLNIHLPAISTDKLELSSGNINIEKQDNSLAMGIAANGGQTGSHETVASLMLDARDNRVNGVGTWNRSNKGEFDGTLMASLSLSDYNHETHSMVSRIDIDTTEIVYNDVDWHISQASVIADSGRLNIDGFKISHQNQYITAEGRVSADSTDVLELKLQQINLDNLLSMMGANKLGFKGIASGSASIMGLTDDPAFFGHIDASDFSFMQTYGGSLSADALWNATDRQVELVADMITGTIASTHASGLYRPENDSIDITIDADNTDLYFLNNFMPKKIFSEIQGRAHGRLRLYGNGGDLDLEGTPLLTDGYFDVIPVNTVYLVPRDTLHFSSGRMEFTGIHVQDKGGHSGLMDCTMSHTRMNDFRDIQLTVDSKGLQIMNMDALTGTGITGCIFIDGKANLLSNGGGIEISGDCSTAKGSWMNIDLGSNSISDNSFLTIVSRSQFNDSPASSDAAQPEDRPQRKLVPTLSMNINANCTEDAEIGLGISSITGNFKGNGNIAIKYDDVNGIFMNGRYTVTQGGCNLSVQNLVDKKFVLLNDDSYVLFTGNPAEAQLNLHTYYNVNSVSLYDLDASASSSQNVQARCLLDVTGQATSPEFSFDVDLPHGTAQEKAILESSTATDEQRNMQFMYLLAIGKFYTYDYASQSTTGITPSTMESLLNGAASGQLNNLLAEVFNTDVFSISSNINAGNYLSSDPSQLINTEFEGILEAHLLDNRLLLNGNFGYRNNAYTNAEGLIGDFEVKWLMFPKYGISVRGYSRNNDRYFTKATLTTQGVGLVYEQDFDHYFKHRKKENQ